MNSLSSGFTINLLHELDSITYILYGGVQLTSFHLTFQLNLSNQRTPLTVTCLDQGYKFTFTLVWILILILGD